MLITQHRSGLRENLERVKRLLARTVDGDDHAAGVSGTIGCQKDGHVGDFAWPGGAPEREVFHQIAVAIFIAQLVPGARFHQVNVAVGSDRPGIDPNDANAIMQASPAERLDEDHQGCVASAAGNIVIPVWGPTYRR